MDKITIFIILLLATIILALIFLSLELFVGTNMLEPKKSIEFVTDVVENARGECTIKVEEKIVNGDSMSPLIKDGQTINALLGYYECNEIKRNDLVLCVYAGNENSLLKIIKAIPGDKFNLQQIDNGWHILINNEIIKNSMDEPYLISGSAYKMLSLYEKDYKETIPENAYLLLGDQISGTLDSTRFGLVDRNNIIAKVEI